VPLTAALFTTAPLTHRRQNRRGWLFFPEGTETVAIFTEAAETEVPMLGDRQLR
jgi:hypothetical protein